MQMETRVLPEPCADFLMRVRTVIIEDTVDIEEFVGALITLFQKFQELLMPVPLRYASSDRGSIAQLWCRDS